MVFKTMKSMCRQPSESYEMASSRISIEHASMFNPFLNCFLMIRNFASGQRGQLPAIEAVVAERELP
jgi:hypothetical protein